ncbi:MAG: hypothetical protein GY821_03575, partial [Gammaproteobacteria bacterium]|nr:hypothetical protein [Gammaproteobacteria bacterium]
QQQQYNRNQGQPPFAQNQNWRPQNQYQGNNPPGNANFSNFNQNQNSGVPRNQYGGNNFSNGRNNAPTPQMNNNNNNRGFAQQQRPQQQQQPPQQQQNRPQGYGNRQPYNNPSVRFMGTEQENYCDNNQDCEYINPNPEPEFCEVSGPDQYQPHESLDENYFENRQIKNEEEQQNYPIAVNNAQEVQNFAEQQYEGSTSENVPIYSQVPFQSTFSNENDIWQKIASKMDHFEQKFDHKFDGINQQIGGVNQRVGDIEQNKNHSSNKGFRLSQDEYNTPWKNNKNTGSTQNQ